MRVPEHVFIPMADGTRLAARIWLPDGEAPAPAVLEYIPYRKRDGTRARDEPMHGYFAAAGFAALRVDLRGSGESDGLLDDEYLQQEQDDALEVIAWIAAQPWCDGNVGMFGKSWGGFNCLQVAARRPPALRAIITVCSTDDRFADDIHYMGGCLLTDNLWWGAIMLAYQARPGDPALLGEDWRAAWLARLDHMPFWPALWLAHQRRDAYWRHGSVCEDFAAIACPVLAVGGWTDAYTNAVPRLLAGLQVPRWGIIGPWAHIYPQDGVPAPAIGFLQEAVRFWDHWLRRADTDLIREPTLRAYIEDWTPPATTRPAAAGRFVAVADWPSPTIVSQILHLTPDGLEQVAAAGGTARVCSPPWTGLAAGAWMGTGTAGEMPGDQRMDDALSRVFDGEPLAADLDLLGNPVLELELSSDQPLAQLAARLCEVAPDGSSLRLSYGVLNLAHRDGSDAPRLLVPGEPVRVRLALKVCGHRCRAGHRLRLALSTAYWPLIWPSPVPATLTLHLAACRLLLPARPIDPAEPPVTFPPPAHGPHAPVTLLDPGRLERSITFDAITGQCTHLIRGEGGLFGEGIHRFDEIDTTVDHGMRRTLTIGPDPLSARDSIAQHYAMGRDGWRIRIETETTLTADATHFIAAGHLRVLENGTEVRERHWHERIPRDHL
jgi:putative CocE/NonD family hydrolase